MWDSVHRMDIRGGTRIPKTCARIVDFQQSAIRASNYEARFRSLVRAFCKQTAT